MGHIQIGEGAESPQIRAGEADALLGFEIGEAVRRGVTFLREGGLAIVNTRKFSPVEVVSGMMKYPSEESLLALLGEVTSDIVTFDATALAEEAGDAISTNMVILGAMVESGWLPFSEEVVLDALRSGVRAAFLETNMKAFRLGQEVFRKSRT